MLDEILKSAIPDQKAGSLPTLPTAHLGAGSVISQPATLQNPLLVIPYPYLTLRTWPIVPTSSLACSGTSTQTPARKRKRDEKAKP